MPFGELGEDFENDLGQKRSILSLAKVHSQKKGFSSDFFSSLFSFAITPPFFSFYLRRLIHFLSRSYQLEKFWPNLLRELKNEPGSMLGMRAKFATDFSTKIEQVFPA